jgi:hypothetical protein
MLRCLHGKEKKAKRRLPRVPGQGHSGKRVFIKKQPTFFPECLGQALGEEDFKKKITNFFPECNTWGRVSFF